jgi:hypothetical protein
MDMKIYKLPASPMKTTLEKKQFPQSTALPNTTINIKITTAFSKYSETTSLPEETIMPETTFGDLDSRLQEEESYIKL